MAVNGTWLSSLGFQGMSLWPPEMCVLIGHFRMGADPEFCFRDAHMGQCVIDVAIYTYAFVLIFWEHL